MTETRESKYILTPEEKVEAFNPYPCLDPSFEDDYSSEVAVLLEAQITKVLALLTEGEPPELTDEQKNNIVLQVSSKGRE
jgi:hypothetical protein